MMLTIFAQWAIQFILMISFISVSVVAVVVLLIYLVLKIYDRIHSREEIIL
jgi:hypothetical protein